MRGGKVRNSGGRGGLVSLRQPVAPR
jgi:hypothetical protein